LAFLKSLQLNGLHNSRLKACESPVLNALFKIILHIVFHLICTRKITL